MIIYPQINNLRIIIVPFVVALGILSYYSFKSHNSIKDYEHFLEQENKMVATELFDMAFAYHDVEVENESLLEQLTVSKEKISRVLDSVQSLTPSTQLLIGYRKQLRLLKEENRRILNLVEKLNAENEFLKVQADYVSQELEYSKGKLSKYEKRNSQLHRNNRGLQKELKRNNIGLQKKLDDASVLIVKGVSVEPIKRFRSDKSIVLTEKAKRTKKLKVCFTIQENKLTKKGMQEYYVQIIDPNNNVVGDRGSITMTDKSTLIKSSMITVYYNKEDLNVCEYIEPSENERFEKGTYFVSIFDANGIVEKTSFDLK